MDLDALPSGDESEGAPLIVSPLESALARQRALPSVLHQMRELLRRGAIMLARHPWLAVGHLGSAVILGLLMGGMYHNLDSCSTQPKDLECQPDFDGVWNRAGAFFFMLAFLSLGSMSAIESFHRERSLYCRERASGYYSPLAYLIPKLLLDWLPMRILPSIILGSIIYHKFSLFGHFEFGMGLNAGLDHFALFLSMLVLFNVCAANLCVTLGVLFPTFGPAILIGILLTLFFMAFGGIVLRMDNMPKGFMWCRWLSPFSAAYEVLMINEIGGRTVLFNPVDQDGNPMCNVPETGEVLLRNMGLVPTAWQKELDIWVLSGLTVLFLATALAALVWIVKERR
eukprot:NODE_2228_length_1258_cov_11.127378_g2029_i0.p1 GENE.NODE_2228_length_1258_cov_11.127378_g2029_i0~~NODE_2228_length_1258_cov_11.127378_g2029_i0.p1  ORF type:complete len:384 (+),score=52.31 NODE_2228_length_1258_cov_11.127378_g2029_i0:131-1153(+)